MATEGARGRDGGAARPRPSARAKALEWLARREYSRQELGRRLTRWLEAERVRAAQASSAAPGDRRLAARGAQRSSSEEPDTPDPWDGDDAAGASVDGADNAELEAGIETLLDELQAAGYLSDERFTESRIHARQSRFGNRRIAQELREHGLSVPAEQRQRLDDTELQRARAALQVRFAGLLRTAGTVADASPPTEDEAAHANDDVESPPDDGGNPRTAGARAQTPREAEWRARARMQRFLLARGFTPATVRAALRDPGDDEGNPGDADP